MGKRGLENLAKWTQGLCFCIPPCGQGSGMSECANVGVTEREGHTHTLTGDDNDTIPVIKKTTINAQMYVSQFKNYNS